MIILIIVVAGIVAVCCWAKDSDYGECERKTRCESK